MPHTMILIVSLNLCRWVHENISLCSWGLAIQGSIAPPIPGSIAPSLQGTIAPPIQGNIAPGIQVSISPPMQGSIAPAIQGNIPYMGEYYPPIHCIVYRLVFRVVLLYGGILAGNTARLAAHGQSMGGRCHRGRPTSTSIYYILPISTHPYTIYSLPIYSIPPISSPIYYILPPIYSLYPIFTHPYALEKFSIQYIQYIHNMQYCCYKNHQFLLVSWLLV